MRDIIIKILRESAEIDEMGIKPSRLKALLPKQYLVKTTKKEQRASEEKQRLKSIVDKVNNLFSQISDDLRNLQWEDIMLIPDGVFFYITLPAKIKTKMKRLADLYGELDENDYTNLVSPKEKIEQFYSDYFNFLEKNFMYTYYDKPRNRTHFPQGLPKSLLGYGIGIKVYRKMLDVLGFMQSEPNATKEVQAIYRKLIEYPDVNCIIYNNLVLLIDKQLSKEEKIQIVSQSIYERYYARKTKKLELNKNIVLDSALLREIGESRFNSLNDRIYDFAKNNYIEPFSEMSLDFYSDFE